MGYSALTAAEAAQDAFLTATVMSKIKDNFDYLYGQFSQVPDVPNGSFEVDSDSDGTPDNWTKNLYPGGALAVDATTPADGAKAIKFTHPGGAGNGGGSLTSDYIPCSEYVIYWMGFMHKASAAGMKNIVQIQYYTAAKVANGAAVEKYDSTDEIGGAPATWTQYIYQFTPTANSRYFKLILIGGYTDTDVAGVAYFDCVRYGLAQAQGQLKTSGGYVSDGGVAGADVTLPGGAYGFYPQIVGGNMNVMIAGTRGGGGLTAATAVSNINFGSEAGVSGGANQTYVTSSGEVYWIFLLRDKADKNRCAIYAAPDHPCFGNGGKPLLVAHPFPGCDLTKYEIIVINPSPEQVKEMEALCNVVDEDLPDLTIPDVIRKYYEIDEDSEPDWPSIPVTVGLPKGRDWKREPDGTPVTPHKKIIPQPDYVKTKTMRLKKADK
jgi:hypothetical protein